MDFVHFVVAAFNRLVLFQLQQVINLRYIVAFLLLFDAVFVSDFTGKGAFITGMYVIFVPICERLLPGFGNKLNLKTWFSAIIGLIGAYMLSGCVSSSYSCFDQTNIFRSGDFIVFASMLCWVFVIIISDVAAKRGVNMISFTIIDSILPAVGTLIFANILEPELWVYPFLKLREAWLVIVLVGVFEGTSFLLATLGQMYVDPSKAALIFSMESVVGAVGGYIFLNETMGPYELIGCFLMLSAYFTFRV